ncbi:hypothetical protein RNAN_3004 [Rheinheimera nanhaiensis E407-8]|uniref:Uncharacterized protein n=1 Tax=Rheinheimera nanhaiensis E407-8 TaxID=562729 RepID=I1E113_9GAMM|nr:hypothetical protein RNAN_3004 [Rheinheimera nanhaiensis E407-8]
MTNHASAKPYRSCTIKHSNTLLFNYYVIEFTTIYQPKQNLISGLAVVKLFVLIQ